MDGDDERALPVLIGEAPSPRGDRYWRFPLSGPPARVLCGMAGIAPILGGSTYGKWTWALYDRFECRNIFERYAEATPWSVPKALQRATELLPDLSDRVVVCLGRRPVEAVWVALGGRSEDLPGFHEWVTGAWPSQIAQLAAIPHPSGRNRLLNDPAERGRCGETLRQALDLAAA